MARKEFDKYYTPFDIAKHCYDKAIEIIGKENISEIIEPSAGAGVFLDIDSSIMGIDIEPEDSRIIQADFLTFELDYKKGRLILGNPPFGSRMILAQKFYKKSTWICDYIAFILPISQLNNKDALWEFDLIYSEDLGIQSYSGKKLHCVFNIYKRPEFGFNCKPKRKLKEVTIYRQDRPNYDELDFDIRMCYWGWSAGKILKEEKETYAGEYKIKIHKEELKDEIRKYIEEYDWKEYSKGIRMGKISQANIVEVLLKKFPELK